MTKIDNKGAIPLLVLISAVAIVVFIGLTSTFSFKHNLFGSLFPKPYTKASEPQITFIDNQGNVITSITSPQVRVRVNSKWPPQPQQTSPTPSPSMRPSSTPSPTPTLTPTPSSTPSSSPSSSPSPSPSTPTYTTTILLSESSNFPTDKTITFPYRLCISSGQLNCVDTGFLDFITNYTFADPSPGTKTLCVELIPTDNQTPSSLCNTIELVNDSLPTSEPTEQATIPPTDQPIYLPTPNDTGASYYIPQATSAPTVYIPSITDSPVARPTPTPTPNSIINTTPGVIIESGNEKPEFIRPSESPENSNLVNKIVTKDVNPLKTQIQFFINNILKTILNFVKP